MRETERAVSPEGQRLSLFDVFALIFRNYWWYLASISLFSIFGLLLCGVYLVVSTIVRPSQTNPSAIKKIKNKQ